jgi:hypothetical protein
MSEQDDFTPSGLDDPCFAPLGPTVIIVPARVGNEDPSGTGSFFLADLAGGRVIDPTLASAERQVGRGDVTLLLTTDSPAIADYVENRDARWLIRRRGAAEAQCGGGYFGALDTARLWAQEQTGKTFATVLILEPSHPFRPVGLITEAADLLARTPALDTAISVVPEYGNLWVQDPYGRLERTQTQEGSVFYREIAGLTLMLRADVMERGSLMGRQVGFIVVEEQWAVIDLHEPSGLQMAHRFVGLLDL